MEQQQKQHAETVVGLAGPFQTYMADPVFATYVLCVVILTVKMVRARCSLLGWGGGGTRAHSVALCVQLVTSFNVTRLRFAHKAFKYEEDYLKAPKEKSKALLAKGADHPAIARAYGLHTNDMENIYVFFTVGLLFALTSPSVLYGKALLWTYTAARVGHMIAYLGALQPWRAVCYLIHVAVVVLMLVHVGTTAIAHL
jgi:uncharacterized membrane protein YecN with MAPEG domain